jgi:thiamine-phosphate pyrophosphorylase
MEKFYLIVGQVDWIARLVPLGVKLVQLRIKDTPVEEVRAQIRRAKQICVAHDCQLIVNDYWQIAIEEHCDFVHLGQEDMGDADFAAIRAANIRFGLSTHDEAELNRALSFNPAYVALGPVYPTILKKMKWAPQGLERVTRWKQMVGDVPLVGIGGLSVERALGVLAAGADSVAVVTDIQFADDPEVRTREWIGICS